MKKRRSVLLALSDTHHGFLRGVLRYAREHDWHLVADMIYTAKIPYGWRGDGIISFIGYRNELADFILDSKVPAVEISNLRKDLPLPHVGGDSGKIGRLAADHFLERGFRNFAWAPFMDDHLNEERYESFSRRLAQKGFSCHQLLPIDTVKAQRGRHRWVSRQMALVRQLKQLPKPLAIFCYNDGVAANIIRACEDAGLAVPESVAVLGVDNDALFCEAIPVPLSSIRHDLEGMAFQAAALLDRLMSGRRAPRKPILVPPLGLVTRRSTDILAADNLEVARALRYIGDHFSNPMLGVDDVVAATTISRRVLEKAFRRDLNRTINGEITRCRLERVKLLLATERMKVADIAAQSGFARTNHLYRSYRRVFGVSPKRQTART
jgi:LacI family transcriptional regulator